MFLQSLNDNNNNNNYGCCESLPPYHNTFANFTFQQQQENQQQNENDNHFLANQLFSPFSNQLISSQRLISTSRSPAETMISFAPTFTSVTLANDISRNSTTNQTVNLSNENELSSSANSGETDNENENRKNFTSTDDGSTENGWAPRDGSEEDYGITYHATKFRYDQAECLCKALENSNSIHKLADFLSDVRASSSAEDAHKQPRGEFSGRQQILRAKALVLFSERKFDEFYEFITSNHFESEHHALLQKLWNEAHYAEAEMLRGKTLDPVSRYRVRKKNAYPSTIWDGEGTSYCFKKSARAVLREAYQRHNTPSQQQKQELARVTKLSVVQVSNWFKNQRQRARQYEREGRAPHSSTYGGYSSGDCEESERENDNENDNENENDNDNDEENELARLSPILSAKRQKLANDAPNESHDSANPANANANANCENSPTNDVNNFSLEMCSDSATIGGNNAMCFAPQSAAAAVDLAAAPFNAFASAADDYEAGGNFSSASRAAAMQICAMAQICNGAQFANGAPAFAQQISHAGPAHFRPGLSYYPSAGLPYSNGCYDGTTTKNEPYFHQFRLFAPTQAPAPSTPMGGVQIGVDHANSLAIPKYESL